jgi:hypothetical protein
MPKGKAIKGFADGFQPLPVPVSRDAYDDHVIACPVAAEGDLIVSRVRDLVDLQEYQGMPVRLRKRIATH